jgi:hypothetical protein
MKNHLKLVTLYDATRHEYTLYRHNLTEDEANEAVRDSRHGFSDSSSSISRPSTGRTIRTSVGPAAEKSNSRLTFNPSPNSKGGANDSTETD